MRRTAITDALMCQGGGSAMNYKTPAEIASAAVNAAAAKTRLSIPQMIVMGFLAGAYVAMGGCFMTVVTQDAAAVAGAGISKLIGGLVFSLGLMLVVSAGGELFTGNCIMPIAILSGRVTAGAALRNLVVVYFSNLAGGVFFALLIYMSGILSPAAAQNALSIAAAKVSIPLSEMVVRGVLCNWFVALAVWMAFGALDMTGKYIVCALPVTAFVAMGFEHSVANMYFIALGLFLKGDSAVLSRCSIPPEAIEKLTLSGYFGNLIPVTAGNIIGAAVLVGILYFIVFRKQRVEETMQK